MASMIFNPLAMTAGVFAVRADERTAWFMERFGADHGVDAQRSADGPRLRGPIGGGHGTALPADRRGSAQAPYGNAYPVVLDKPLMGVQPAHRRVLTS